MGDEPRFPPPRASGPVYRHPAVLPIQRSSRPVRRAEVSRPEPPVPDNSQARARPQQTFDAVLREERAFWRRHQIFARYPRAIGLLGLGLGGWLLYSLVDTLLHGGYYGVRSTVLAPVLALTGAWSVAFGYPLERNGRPPVWWTAGITACAVTGLLIGLALLAARF